MNGRNGAGNGEAIVIGASMGGLLAARILADHFERVTLIERDTLPAADQPRAGVPQGRHTHGLLARGREILETLFPELTRELLERGAVPFDIERDVRMYLKGGYHCAGIPGVVGIGVGRPLLEGRLRARLLERDNVRLLERCEVRGLLTDADGRRVRGVRLIRRPATGDEESLVADLVVDAGGRHARSPHWLEALGFPRPVETEIGVDLTYTTRLFRRDPRGTGVPGVLIVGPTDSNRRMGIVLAQSHERWIVTLAGYFGEYAPAEDAGFLAYARGLATPDLYRVIRDAEPVGGFASYRFPSSLRRYYERLDRFPEGLLVFGDAICSFNPVFGQGMTVAALEAIVLDRTLREGHERLARRYFAGVGEVVDMVWSLMADDLNFPETRGERTVGFHLVSRYMARLHVAARRDPVVAEAFARVANLLEPPSSVMHPRIAWRLLRGGIADETRVRDPLRIEAIG